jgi:NADPH-dependent F420 reductase
MASSRRDGAVWKGRRMGVGIFGGTGPAGRGLAVRLAAVGEHVVIGSRDAARAEEVAGKLVEAWPGHQLAITGASNEETASSDLVVVATPWDSAIATLRPLASALEGKVVVSMANALAKEGREFLALVPPRGSVAASIQAALPKSLVSASFHHLPASEMERLTTPLVADVLVCSDHAEASDATVALVDRIEGLRGVDAGSLSQAAPIEAFTAVLITVNIRHKVHAAVQLAGYGDR